VAAATCYDNYVVAWSDDGDEHDVEHLLLLADDNDNDAPDQCCLP
jgi:hypothetical protein